MHQSTEKSPHIQIPWLHLLMYLPQIILWLHNCSKNLINLCIMLILSPLMSFVSNVAPLAVYTCAPFCTCQGEKWHLELDTFKLPQTGEGKDDNASTIQLIDTRIGIVVLEPWHFSLVLGFFDVRSHKYNCRITMCTKHL